MIKSKVSKWFEVKVVSEKTTESGEVKKVKEVYVVDALSFTEAESRTTTELVGISGCIDIVEEKIAKYDTVIFNTDCEEERWWKVKVEFLMTDDNGKEKKMPTNYLVEAESNENALNTMKHFLHDTVLEFWIVDVVGTPIVETFVHLMQ